MPETSRDLAQEWAKLLVEREAALAAYRAASDAAGPPGEKARGRGPSVEECAERLAEIKRRMDAVIAAGRDRRRRQPDREHLVVVALDTRDADLASERADGLQDSRARMAK